MGLAHGKVCTIRRVPGGGTRRTDHPLPCAAGPGTRRTNYLRRVPEIVARGEFIPTSSGSGHAVFLLFAPCTSTNTRQSCLSCARNLAHGKLGLCHACSCHRHFAVSHPRRIFRRVPGGFAVCPRHTAKYRNPVVVAPSTHDVFFCRNPLLTWLHE